MATLPTQSQSWLIPTSNTSFPFSFYCSSLHQLSLNNHSDPKHLFSPVTKDSATTLQYIAQINQRTPLVPLNLVVDLGGKFLWVDCENHYTSSTYRPVRCPSAQCSLAKSDSCGDCFSSPKPGCNNTCGLIPDNTITHSATRGDLAEDVLSIQSTSGFNTGQNVVVSRFLFSCAPTSLLRGLAGGASGMAGLGRTKIALPSQLASAFIFKRKFAFCFSSSDGVIIFGDGPYSFLADNPSLPNVVFDSKSLTYTPLLINHVSTASAFLQGESSVEYFIGVKTIKIDGKVVSLNSSLLSIDNKGVGGTKISTVDPYTVLEASIYKAVTDAFVKASVARNITTEDSSPPFEFCYSFDNLPGTPLGASVPTIELLLQNNVIWSMFGANSMVNINDEVLCLGFVNGGVNLRTSIVIGGYQLENNLLQFDLAASRLGFSNTIFAHQTDCFRFNFTSTA
ncbi:putative nepenthesin [Medicago truncatula]|uniref:Putative nepenthesin n=1 Tax=Medicago truncatula TaxID=3880 RepID=G7IEE3_MEDTR|nr:xyloglucanase-specific endoglucanase inhibitor protein [Medicago truncatula]RHN80196.1 putative nepenthesin [Medicago truncatula]